MILILSKQYMSIRIVARWVRSSFEVADTRQRTKAHSQHINRSSDNLLFG